MEPAFQRGDVLFLDNNMDEVEVGDVVVYKIKDRDIPIVHRVLSVYQRSVVYCGLVMRGLLCASSVVKGAFGGR